MFNVAAMTWMMSDREMLARILIVNVQCVFMVCDISFKNIAIFSFSIQRLINYHLNAKTASLI